MLVPDKNRHRQVSHLFTGIPFILLYQEWFGVPGSGEAGSVVEHPLGPVIQDVLVLIAGQRLGILGVMGRYISVLVCHNDKDEPFILDQILVQDFLKRFIEGCVISGFDTSVGRYRELECRTYRIPDRE